MSSPYHFWRSIMKWYETFLDPAKMTQSTRFVW